MPAIRDAVSAASEDCVLVAGNSHAEFLGTPDFDGRRCINLGIGGDTAADCAAQLAGLCVPVRTAAAVLLIGTNDIMRWRHPERVGARRRFEADGRRILATLEAWSAQVFVAAVPPIGAGATSRDPAAVAAFSACLQTLCREGGHIFFDPFAAMRNGGPGLARTGLHGDGIHMADYRGLAEEIVRQVVLRTASSSPWKPRAPSPIPATPAFTTPCADAVSARRKRLDGAVAAAVTGTIPKDAGEARTPPKGADPASLRE